MNNRDMLQQAEDIDKVITEGTMCEESVVARVLNYCLKRDEEVRKETLEKLWNGLQDSKFTIGASNYIALDEIKIIMKMCFDVEVGG